MYLGQNGLAAMLTTTQSAGESEDSIAGKMVQKQETNPRFET